MIKHYPTKSPKNLIFNRFKPTQTSAAKAIGSRETNLWGYRSVSKTGRTIVKTEKHYKKDKFETPDPIMRNANDVPEYNDQSVRSQGKAKILTYA